MKKSVFFKKLAGDFLKVVPDLDGQETVLKEAEQTRPLRPFVDAVRHLQEEQGIAKVIGAYSAVALTGKEKEKLKKELEARWKMPIVLKEVLDATVIGGVKLVAADWEYEATIKGGLTRLEKTFTT